MKSFLPTLMATLLLLISFDLKAQDFSDYYCEEPCCVDPCCLEDPGNFYLEMLGGVNFLQTETNSHIKSTCQPGYVLSASLGYRWCYGLRLEVEYAFRRTYLRKVHFFEHDFPSQGHFQSSSYMTNLLWDFPYCFWGIEPYVGGGAGFDFQQIRSCHRRLKFNESNKGFSWQVITGLVYQTFCGPDIILDYKFHKGGFDHIYSHSVGIGVIYRYGAGYPEY